MQHTKDWLFGLIAGAILFTGIILCPEPPAHTQPTITNAPQVHAR